ncbi:MULTISPECIES: alpha/beta hydrolase [Xanthomonas]|uniref:IroE protein n=2 Tax=Xanthomonas TaxID=338 RepID=A0A7Z7NEV8_XANCH|nr:MULTISPECIES: alpha/beta hydrolase-fold protein [Xanthomonas]ATS40291.1 alpha/beta hydrolase [Xanthomonas citri pv. phaseoli var. fuscans]ATS44789.1 alpha/beta hydrolase [Xanthomonas citri pv. phaseoli var. fuscans]ATS48299.1 alpha/beta hydrolase [Xanthomonas citri pv. phaseoli var. fuscans]ATS85320.1 alpha/beta hydrolase [Xanthomonas citri pv. phaseoli var. fuscans]QWN21914.1 alpha/beta hydrolase [Xanthomonas citri]
MHRCRWTVCICMSLSLVCATPALAQPDLSRTIGSTVADRASASYVFSALRLTAADGQRRYRVRIAVPKTPPPTAGYPVVYLLDGNAALMELDAHLLDSLSSHGDAPVLVFIADDSALRIDAIGRSLDYTPARYGDGRVETDPLNPQRRTGGAAAFAQLIATRIRPQVEARVAVDTGRQTVWGHSYGGLFVLHVLLTQPQLFQHYVAVDPSLWWGDGFIVDQAHRVVDAAKSTDAHTPQVSRSVTVMAGEGEPATRNPAARATPTERPGRPRADPHAAPKLVALLSSLPGIKADYRPLPGLTHGQTLGASLAPTLRDAAAR